MTRAFPVTEHDHEACIESAIGDAEALCRDRGVRLTPLRKRVLELVWQRHQPVGAYEILDLLRAEGRKAAPPTVYRALDFLMENGLVHRLHTMNAFIGCATPDRRHDAKFLICRRCGTVAEVEDRAFDLLISAFGEKGGFRLENLNIEATGLCPPCQSAEDHAAGGRSRAR